MSQFQHQFPEVQDNGMPGRSAPGFQFTNQGQPVINGVRMENLRLHQLRHLARAWGIKVDMDSPKRVILPALTAAADSGVFQQQPKLPYYAWMATRTGDERMPIQHPHFEYPDGMPAPKPIDDEMLPSEKAKILSEEEQRFADMYKAWSYSDLRAEAKRVDPSINLYGVSRVALGMVLYRHNIRPDQKPTAVAPALQE